MNKFKETPIGDGLRRVAEVRAEYEKELSSLRKRIAQLEADKAERDAQEPHHYWLQARDDCREFMNSDELILCALNLSEVRDYNCDDSYVVTPFYAAPMSAKEGYQLDVDAVMAQAQAFASSWALVGSPFDDGREIDNAEAMKEELRQMLLTATKGEEKEYQLVPVTVTEAMEVVYLNEFDVYETAQEMHDAMPVAVKKGGEDTWKKQLHADELDGRCKLFGWKYSEGGRTGLVTIYIKGDENWHPKMTFDRLGADDFRAMALYIVPRQTM